MAKRLTKEQKVEIIKKFSNGETIEQLSSQYECARLTISRNLKKSLGENKYQELILGSKTSKNLIDKEDEKIPQNPKEDLLPINPFMEITPLVYEIENQPQKDLSSLPISDINFPKVVFMVVEKNIELVTKYLKDYPEWQFLSNDDLNRKTIQIFDDLKVAKSYCNKEQKVIKVPNTEVFRIAAPILVSRGISRIVSDNKLIAL